MTNMVNIIIKIHKRIRNICSNLPATKIRKIERAVEIYLKLKSYHYFDRRNSDSSLIDIISKDINNGGLTDRINGCVSAYHIAETTSRDFKIVFDYPFELTDYLIPNEINWKIARNKVSFGWKSRVVFIRAFNQTMAERVEQLKQISLSNRNKQLHVYTNIMLEDDRKYHDIYAKLFKPSNILQEMIDNELNRIGQEYIAVTLRFQQLFGDFKEGNYPILSNEDAEYLCKKCISDIQDIHNQNPNRIIVVTSDSMTFLKRVSTLNYIHIISGKVIHMQYTKGDFLSNAKSFIDLYIVANAEKIYQILNTPMRRSGFPKLASKIYNKEYIEIIK